MKLYYLILAFCVPLVGMNAFSQEKVPNWRDVVGEPMPLPPFDPPVSTTPSNTPPGVGVSKAPPSGSPAESLDQIDLTGYIAGTRGVDTLTHWTQGVVDILYLYGNRAAQYRNQGKNEEAVTILIQGLVNAHKSQPQYHSGPLAARAVGRGIQLARRIGAAIKSEPNATRTMMRLLFEYYEFIGYVADNLDFPYYIPYLGCGQCRSANPFGNSQFETNYIWYAKEQIEFILRTFAMGPSQQHYGHVIPIGARQAYIQGLSIASRSAAWDLRESVYAPYYAREIDGLEYLSKQLIKMAYPDIQYAVTDSFYVSRSILEGIRPSQANWEYPYKGPVNSKFATITCDQRNFQLTSGQTKSVKFDQKLGVQHIYVQAEAYSTDAHVQVFANGELRGDLRIPAYDPSYFVPIERDVETIEFRHVSGGRVKIFEVNAVIENSFGYPYHPYTIAPGCNANGPQGGGVHNNKGFCQKHTQGGGGPNGGQYPHGSSNNNPANGGYGSPHDHHGPNGSCQSCRGRR